MGGADRSAGRVERDPNRVALLVPALNYSPDRPLPHFARAVFARRGWTTQDLPWRDRPPQRDGQDLTVGFRSI
jgi:hypothetical protein